MPRAASRSCCRGRSRWRRSTRNCARAMACRWRASACASPSTVPSARGTRTCPKARKWPSSHRCRAAEVEFLVSAEPFEIAPRREALLASGAGAYASFEGWVRDHSQGRVVLALSYEAYGALAQAEGNKVLSEARERFAILDLACVHRVGELQVGD